MLKVLRRRGFTLAAMGPRLGDTRYGFIRVEGANPAAMGPSPGRLGDPDGRSSGSAVKVVIAAMGPSLGRLGDFGVDLYNPESLTPQWGRASEGSETTTPVVFGDSKREAAMGPSLGRLGDTTLRPHCLTLTRRNGAEPRKARRRTRDTHRAADRRRNGAEPRKARRPESMLGHAHRGPLCRNGAEPRKARRLSEGTKNMKLQTHGPQWGRASEGSETNTNANASSKPARWSRNGAEPRKARRLRMNHYRGPIRVIAAMGPSLGRLGDARTHR